MSKRVKFHSRVSQAVFDKAKGAKCCLEAEEMLPLAEEEDIAARNITFQIINRIQKQQLHKLHIRKGKKSRLFMHPDIADKFWAVYENKAWEKLIELNGNINIAAEDIALTAITSVDKNEVIKEWRERLMMLFPIVEQFHMVPYHDRWIQSQFKDEENINKMKEMLAARRRSTPQWFDDLTLSPETQIFPESETTTAQEASLPPEFNLENVTEVLDELEENNPEIFDGLIIEESSPAFTDDQEQSSALQWFVDLVNDLVPSTETQICPGSETLTSTDFHTVQETSPLSESNNEQVREVMNPEILEEIIEGEDGTTDRELTAFMEEWEEQEMTTVLDSRNYDYLLENEVLSNYLSRN